MGEAEILPGKGLLVIHAELICYGDAASDELCMPGSPGCGGSLE